MTQGNRSCVFANSPLLGTKLNIEVIAEGVEDQGQARILTKLGCKLV
jgi:EAL domain-containing protein (putative c-di-GMP-specific phosphodiesterase class I)